MQEQEHLEYDDSAQDEKGKDFHAFPHVMNSPLRGS